MSFYYYRLYGLHIASERHLSYLVTAPATNDPDVIVRFSAWPYEANWHRHPSYQSLRPGDQEPDPHLTIEADPDDTWIRFRYSWGLNAMIRTDGREVYINHSPARSFDAAVAFLVGPITGFCLRLQGVICLHASACVIGGKAVALCGHRGMGKSTLATALLRQGCSIISDDIVALRQVEGVWYASAGYPYLRVDPAKHVNDATRVLAPEFNKALLSLGESFYEDQMRLRGVLILKQRSLLIRQPIFETLRGGQALFGLLPHTYMSYIRNNDMRGHELDSLGHIASKVSIVEAKTPADIHLVDETAEALRSHFS